MRSEFIEIGVITNITISLCVLVVHLNFFLIFLIFWIFFLVIALF